MVNVRKTLRTLAIVGGIGPSIALPVGSLTHKLLNPYNDDRVIETYGEMKQSLDAFVSDRNALSVRAGIVTPYDGTPEDVKNLKIAYGVEQNRFDAFNALISRQQDVNRKYWDDNPVLAQNKEWIERGEKIFRPIKFFPYMLAGLTLALIGVASSKRKNERTTTRAQTE